MPWGWLGVDFTETTRSPPEAIIWNNIDAIMKRPNKAFEANRIRVESVAVMFLKCHPRIKDGKEHRYWSIAEALK